MKLIPIFSFLILPFFVFQFSGCSVSQQTNSLSESLENKVINSPSVTPKIPDYASNFDRQNIVERAREKYDMTLAELERNRKLWEESKIINYDFLIDKAGTNEFMSKGGTNEFMASLTLIKIRNGEKSSMESVEKDRAFNVESYNNFDTMDKLFNYLRQELDDRNIVEVKYDKILGYPKSIRILFSNSTHGGRGIRISKFKVIKQI